MQFEMVNKTIGLVAKRCSGKSIMLRWLVDMHKHEFKKIYVINIFNKTNIII
jgi:ABC-type dipeptide/oligopeptide/nickel transport system ATPase subunit